MVKYKIFKMAKDKKFIMVKFVISFKKSYKFGENDHFCVINKCKINQGIAAFVS